MTAILRRPHHLASLRSCLKSPSDPEEGAEEGEEFTILVRCRGVCRGTQALPKRRSPSASVKGKSDKQNSLLGMPRSRYYRNTTIDSLVEIHVAYGTK